MTYPFHYEDEWMECEWMGGSMDGRVTVEHKDIVFKKPSRIEGFSPISETEETYILVLSETGKPKLFERTLLENLLKE